jgi:hypothetical protein
VPRGPEPVKGRVRPWHGSCSAVTRPPRRSAAIPSAAIGAPRPRDKPKPGPARQGAGSAHDGSTRGERLATYRGAPSKRALLKNAAQRRAACGD